jgi:hypothetical protein
MARAAADNRFTVAAGLRAGGRWKRFTVAAGLRAGGRRKRFTVAAGLRAGGRWTADSAGDFTSKRNAEG